MSGEFEALQAKWYQKLKESGFEDIEDEKRHLKMWHSFYYRTMFQLDYFEFKKTYYQKAEHFLNTYCFDPKEKLVWKLHSEGMSMRDISKNTGLKKYRIFSIIHKLKKKMIGDLTST